MKNQRIGVGFVGLSSQRGWAALAHLPALALLPQFEVRGLVGSTPENARAAGEKYGIPFTTHRFEELLARDDIDLVVVTVVVPKHYEIVKAALLAGKAVFCEWPLACNLGEATALYKLSQQQSVPCFVNMQAGHSPAVRYISDLLAAGSIGEVLSTTMVGTGGAPWGLDVIDSIQEVYQDRTNGANVLTIPFGHLLYALSGLFGPLENPRATLAVQRSEVRVRDTGEVLPVTAPDQVCISGRFASGPIASVHYRAGAETSDGLRWEINGRDGYLLVTAPTGHLQFGDVRIQLSTRQSPTLLDMEIPERYWPLEGPRTGVGYTVAVAYQMILDDLRNGTDKACGIRDALALHQSIHEIEQSAL